MIETDIFDALKDLVANRCYPLMMPQNPTLPAIVYSRQASTPQYRLEGGSSLSQIRMEIDCYANTYEDAKSLASEVRSAMELAAFKGTMIFDADFYEPDVKLYRVVLDFYVWEIQ
jgi:hypothetical protein